MINLLAIGTTDHKQTASMRPEPNESEIRWLLTEASKYLSPDVHMRRKDVLSAWYDKNKS